MAGFCGFCGQNTLRDLESQINPFLPRNIEAPVAGPFLNQPGSRPEIIEGNPSLPAVLYDTNATAYDMSGDKFHYIFCHESYMNTKHFKRPPSRDGAIDDANLLSETLVIYGFRFKIYYDMKFDQIVDVISRVSQQDHTRTSCLWVSIMTHATSNALLAADMAYRLWQIEILLQNANLARIPKILLLPYIRAGNERPGFIDRTLPQPSQNESASCDLSYNAVVDLWYGCFEWTHTFYNQVLDTECEDCPVCRANNVDNGNIVQCASGDTILHPSTSDFFFIHAANNDVESISVLIRAMCEALQENQELELEYGDLIPIMNQKVCNNTAVTDTPETRFTSTKSLRLTRIVTHRN